MVMPVVQKNLIELKIKRAQQHLAELKAAIEAHGRPEDYEISVDLKSDPDYVIGWISKMPPWNPMFAVIAGDALHNLRSALDHIVFALICFETNAVPAKPTRCTFPIAASKEAYWKADFNPRANLDNYKFSGVIHGLQPYKSGHPTLWMLHQLNNIDKHRLLLTASVQSQIFFNGDYFGTVPTLHVNQEIFKVKRDLFKEKGDVYIKGVIGFGEREVAYQEPMESLLATMSNDVIDILLDFNRRGLLDPHNPLPADDAAYTV